MQALIDQIKALKDKATDQTAKAALNYCVYLVETYKSLQDAYAEYSLDCQGPGKFEECSPISRYVYEAILDGSTDRIEPCSEYPNGLDVYELGPLEQEVFDAPWPFYCIEETEQGFVYGYAFDENPLDHAEEYHYFESE